MRYYDETPVTETVIVRPDYDYVEKRQLIGNISGLSFSNEDELFAIAGAEY